MKNRKAVFRTNGLLILASASPRRREFLEDLGLDFAVAPAHVDESALPDEDPGEFVVRISVAKAKAVAGLNPDAWILAADTAVVIEGKILGKPESEDDALDMILELSGRRHEVWTGFCLFHHKKNVAVHRSVQTSVTFDDFSEEVCRAYVKTGDPLDKAGAYGIQSKAGFLVREISGSYSNVVGLPLSEVVAELIRYGVILPKS